MKKPFRRVALVIAVLILVVGMVLIRNYIYTESRKDGTFWNFLAGEPQTGHDSLCAMPEEVIALLIPETQDAIREAAQATQLGRR